MARWTANNKEVAHLAQVNQQLPLSVVLEVIMQDGSAVEGLVRRLNVGNNGGAGGWSYYGELEIEDKSRTRWVIDFLDIAKIRDASSPQKLDEYQKLGLITLRP